MARQTKPRDTTVNRYSWSVERLAGPPLRPLANWQRRVANYLASVDQEAAQAVMPQQWLTGHSPARPRCGCCSTPRVVGDVANVPFCPVHADLVEKEVARHVR